MRLEIENPSAVPVSIGKIHYRFHVPELDYVDEGVVEGGDVVAARQTVELEFAIFAPLPEAKLRQIIGRGFLKGEVQGRISFAANQVVGFRKKVRAETPQLLTVILHDAELARVDDSRLYISLFLRVVNPNAFSVSLEGLQYKIFVGDEALRDQTAMIGTRVLQGAAQELELSLKLNAKKSRVARKVLEGGALKYRVAGELSVRGLSAPFDLAGELKLNSED